VATDIVHPLRGLVSKELLDRLLTLRSKVVLLAQEICMLITLLFVFPGYQITWISFLMTLVMSYQNSSHVILLIFYEDHGDMSAVSELQRALEEYLPVVLGLTLKGLNFFSLSFMYDFHDSAKAGTQLHAITFGREPP
jgi:hypothetical protein